MGNGASTSTNILERQVIYSKGRNKHLIFSGNKENAIINGEILLEERISLFNGRTNPIHCFSVDDLNSMNVDEDGIYRTGHYQSHRGVWEGMLVLVKIFYGAKISNNVCRDIAVATQMGTHRNVHRLLGCCLGTKYPVLIYQWEENGTLEDRIFKYNEHGKRPLEWKERLRIAWEIAHALAYLHTAFPRPIIHRDLKLDNVFLDQDDSARLTEFGFSISIPEGEDHVEDNVIGTLGYIAPEYFISLRIAESTDVFAFGTNLLILVTGKPAFGILNCDGVRLVDWVRERANCHCDIVDPVIINKPIGVHLKHDLEAVIKLALSCTAVNEESRPSMVDVATQLKNMMSNNHIAPTKENHTNTASQESYQSSPSSYQSSPIIEGR